LKSDYPPVGRLRLAVWRTNWLGAVLSGVPLPPLGSILVAHKPIDGPKRDYGRRKCEQFLRCMSNVKDQELAHDGEHCNQDHGTDLDDAVLPLGSHEQRPFELQRNDDGKDHAEHGLKNLVVGWVKRA
jgi:hypothetical protein